MNVFKLSQVNDERLVQLSIDDGPNVNMARGNPSSVLDQLLAKFEVDEVRDVLAELGTATGLHLSRSTVYSFATRQAADDLIGEGLETDGLRIEPYCDGFAIVRYSMVWDCDRCGASFEHDAPFEVVTPHARSCMPCVEASAKWRAMQPQESQPPSPNLFELMRDGEVVAQGVEFEDDGPVAVRWLTSSEPVVYASLESVALDNGCTARGLGWLLD